MSTHLSLTGLSPSLAGFPKTFLLDLLNQLRGPNPAVHAPRFGLFRFRFGSGPEVLNLASTRNSPDRSTKSTRFTT